MEILNLGFFPFRNQEFFQLMTGVRQIVFPLPTDHGGPQTITLQAQASILEPFRQPFLEKLSQLDDRLIIIEKSEFTEQITLGDVRRDNSVIGFKLYVQAFSFSNDEDEREASRILQIPIDAHKNFHRKNMNEQTASTHNFLQDVDARAEHVATIRAEKWVEEIRNANNDFDQLMNRRLDEKSVRPTEDIRQVRKEIEFVYKQMTSMLEIANTLSPSTEISNVIKRINELLTYYKNTIATRKGVANAKKEKEKGENPEIITSED